MNNAPEVLKQILAGLAIQSPVLLVCLIGFVAAFFLRHRSGAGAFLVMAGLVLMGVSVIGAIVTSTLLSMVFREDMSREALSRAFTVSAVVWSIARALSTVLFIWAPFYGRKAASDPVGSVAAPPLPRA